MQGTQASRYRTVELHSTTHTPTVGGFVQPNHIDASCVSGRKSWYPDSVTDILAQADLKYIRLGPPFFRTRS
ncbi:hypothetical protein QC764_0032180 [Podospora pseudoanserina]|uniref:Uncharacterized protein n=1 Tax=Podospora pseudoanserina TaxID=2609844 RepID=A0ABR0IFK8_9PEZI|nr:hypothetical protein QC764_0032180 [Podospora pseudoanserina]